MNNYYECFLAANKLILKIKKEDLIFFIVTFIFICCFLCFHLQGVNKSFINHENEDGWGFLFKFFNGKGN